VQTLEKAVGDRGLQLLINNAGIFLRDGQSLELISKNTMLAYFEVNMFAALFVTQVR
jgi:NAD(P)-dependent dehydrogenase (short-subunit alcohol dehydrogenase family)